MQLNGPFHHILPINKQVLVEIFNGESSTDFVEGLKAVTKFTFDPTNYLNNPTVLDIKLVANVDIEDAAETATISIYNRTDAEYITTSEVTHTGDTVTTKLISGTIPVGVAAGYIKTTEKMYELHIEITGSDATDIVNIYSAWLLITRA